MKTKKNDTKKLFRKIGPCSSTYMFLLNREFDNPKGAEVNALGPLAGGVNRLGYQCGMLWGASLGAGAEAYRRFDSMEEAITITLKTSQELINSFKQNADTIECYELTDCDWNSKMGMAKYFFTGKFMKCFNLAEDWTEEMIETTRKGMEKDSTSIPTKCISCASEVLKKVGASNEEVVMVSGFAGGLGLSGNACGALAAVIWWKNIDRTNTKEYKMRNEEAEEAIEKFYVETDYKMLCSEITGKNFETIEEHSDFIENGGCKNLIEALAKLN